MSGPEETEIWTEEDYTAIDAVAPYDPAGRYYTAEAALNRAREATRKASGE